MHHHYRYSLSTHSYTLFSHTVSTHTLSPPTHTIYTHHLCSPRLDHATQSYQFEKLNGEKGYEDRSHAQEKAVLYAEMKKLKGAIDKNNDMSILHKRQMQAMKQAMAEHEKTKLKLRAAEMKADDASDELRTLRQRSHELEERVVTLESDTVYDKLSAEMETMKVMTPPSRSLTHTIIPSHLTLPPLVPPPLTMFLHFPEPTHPSYHVPPFP